MATVFADAIAVCVIADTPVRTVYVDEKLIRLLTGVSYLLITTAFSVPKLKIKLLSTRLT